MIIERYLLGLSGAQEAIHKTLAHGSQTAITTAKILEIPTNKFDLDELRETYLKTGQSDWLSWSSAVGARQMKKSSRNQILKYFKNGSQINNVIGKIVIGM